MSNGETLCKVAIAGNALSQVSLKLIKSLGNDLDGRILENALDLFKALSVAAKERELRTVNYNERHELRRLRERLDSALKN